MIELYEEIETTMLDHAVLNEELANDINGSSALKHLKQQVGYLTFLQHYPLLHIIGIYYWSHGPFRIIS